MEGTLRTVGLRQTSKVRSTVAKVRFDIFIIVYCYLKTSKNYCVLVQAQTPARSLCTGYRSGTGSEIDFSSTVVGDASYWCTTGRDNKEFDYSVSGYEYSGMKK